MRAMILAAGYGTRLKPLTNTTPKALIEVQGKPLLEWVILKLRNNGVNSIIINTHYLAPRILNFLREKKFFDIHIEISHEEEILDTGGGIKRAVNFLKKNDFFFVHNVDVLSDINLQSLVEFHKNANPMATLFVQRRFSSRYLLFDEKHQLVGRATTDNSQSNPSLTQFAFNGIHIISTKIFDFMPDLNSFSIIDVYLSLLKKDKKIMGYENSACYWRDVGRLKSLEQIELDFDNAVINRKLLLK